MKKFLITLIFLSSFCFGASLEDYYKIYPFDADTLFIKTLAALNSASGFEIYEIQTKNGYILFSHNSKFYLLTLTKRYQNQTEIKILPQNSSFNPEDTTAKTLFSLIDLKNSLEIVK